MPRRNIGSNQIGFTFVEIMITVSLFMVLASIGVGSYFRYYRFSLVNNDLGKITKVLHETRFRAMKNPYNSDYGIYLDQNTNELITFRDTYTPGNIENITITLEQLNFTNFNLLPTPGVTHSILFENITGKTLNKGSFTIDKEEFSYTININEQGAFE